MNTALENIENEIKEVKQTIEEAVADKDMHHASLMRAKLSGLTIAKGFVEAENVPQVKSTKAQNKWIKKTREFLNFEDDDSEQTILNVIAKIRDHKDQSDTIDHVISDDNVYVVERFEHVFTCEDFLAQIGYK